MPEGAPPGIPWWLEAGPERCPFCLASFHLEAAVYCVACDQPVCPVCFVEIRETRAVLCPECREEEEG